MIECFEKKKKRNTNFNDDYSAKFQSPDVIGKSAEVALKSKNV